MHPPFPSTLVKHYLSRKNKSQWYHSVSARVYGTQTHPTPSYTSSHVIPTTAPSGRLTHGPMAPIGMLRLRILPPRVGRTQQLLVQPLPWLEGRRSIPGSGGGTRFPSTEDPLLHLHLLGSRTEGPVSLGHCGLPLAHAGGEGSASVCL